MTIWQTIRKNPMVLAWAIIVHLLAFAAIGISFKSSDPKISAVKKEKVIEAVAINERKIEEEIKKLRQVDKRKEREQKRLQNKAQKAKSDRRKEEKKLRALKKKQKEQERINKNKRIKENKRLAALEKKTKAQERQAQNKLNKLEKERQEKKALLEKEESERKAKVAEKKRLIEKQQSDKQKSIDVDKYRSLIRGKITNKWIIPASYETGMKCEVLVRLIPSGDVVSVYISKSSGNSSFDRSVEQAVKKSSPLPLPASNKNLFNEFREVRLVFSPNL